MKSNLEEKLEENLLRLKLIRNPISRVLVLPELIAESFIPIYAFVSIAEYAEKVQFHELGVGLAFLGSLGPYMIAWAIFSEAVHKKIGSWYYSRKPN